MNNVTLSKNYVTHIQCLICNLIALKSFKHMKAKHEKTNFSAGSDFDIPGSELGKNQEFDRSEYLEDIFYSFLGENHNNLVEDIKNWEACRFMI